MTTQPSSPTKKLTIDNKKYVKGEPAIIFAGKSYLRFDGAETAPLLSYFNLLLDPATQTLYNIWGQIHALSIPNPNAELVAEILPTPSPVPPSPIPQLPPLPPITLEVGKRYIARNGEVTQPLRYDKTIITDHRYYDDISWRAYKQNGQWGYELMDEKDLIKEFCETPAAPAAPQSSPTRPTHQQLVASLVKDPTQIVATLTPEKADIWHAATGVATEAGELLDAAKKHCIYNKPIDYENVVEELGDLEFYMEALRSCLKITRQETLDANIDKLLVRYAKGYSDQQAQERADKKE
jgi:NTP pyrophosphatase (non-canonical NTP hydrolase)